MAQQTSASSQRYLWILASVLLVLGLLALPPILLWNALLITAKQEADGAIVVDWTDHFYFPLLPSWTTPSPIRECPQRIYFNGFNEHQEIMTEVLPRLPGSLKVVSIAVGNGPLANRLFTAATQVESLETLQVHRANLKEEELGRLSHLRNLRSLTLSDNTLTFENFPRMENLETLVVDATHLTPAGLKRLLECPSLTSLSLGIPDGTDWKAYEWKSPTLQELLVGHVKMTDGELHAAAASVKTTMPKLHRLEITNGRTFIR